MCDYKRIEILEANACVDHIRMCIKILPNYSVSQVMGYLKGKSSLMIFEQSIMKICLTWLIKNIYMDS